MNSTSDRTERTFWRWTAVILAAYAGGLLFFAAETFVSTDESIYVEQAVAWASGSGFPAPVSHYPPGTSLLQVPFVKAGGWQAAAWASVASLAATIVMLGRWLIDLRYPPFAALLFLVFAPTLVLGRIGMSDVPSAAVVTAGLWLFWTGVRSARRWFAAGLLAGLSLLFRETNVLLFIPFYLGAIGRRENGWIWLAGGFVVGMSVRLATSQWLFGSPFFVHSQSRWSLGAAFDSLPIYVFALLVMVPGGLVAVATYGGERRRELKAAVALYLCVYVFYVYSGQSSQPFVRLAAAGRYLIPLVPLVAVAWADMARRHAWPVRRLLPGAGIVALAGALLVHPVVHWWGAREAAVAEDIVAQTRDGDALIASWAAQKYVSPVYGPRRRIWIERADVADLPAITAQNPGTFLVRVSREDTSPAAVGSDETERFVSAARQRCRVEQVFDRTYDGSRRLGLWRIDSCNGNPLRDR
ncbi:MAG: hypothetical protein A3H29_15850 [Acidobacteria bacterium RIFCSPLOWO2_02_FULL_67_21]|nr:MAG: hypothetical protein A3H29_15850 [Acidobacteria bacterium RIFCSPLOWO2_02_FULL_67_21]